MKQLIKSLIPPIFINILHRYKNRKYGWFGDYATWEEAKKASTGYDSDAILQKVRMSLLKVKNGEAVYERDSVIFEEIQYSWPLLSGLLLAASSSNGNLRVLDFGGSLGSTYYQNKKFLDRLNSVSWSIVEQKHFVDIGKIDFEDDRLKFYYDVTECVKEQKPNVLILSSVLQYIEEPYLLIKYFLTFEFDTIIIDRTVFGNQNFSTISVQHIPNNIYNKTSIPSHLLSLTTLYSLINHKYDLIEEWSSYQTNQLSEKGSIWKIK